MRNLSLIVLVLSSLATCGALKVTTPPITIKGLPTCQRVMKKLEERLASVPENVYKVKPHIKKVTNEIVSVHCIEEDRALVTLRMRMEILNSEDGKLYCTSADSDAEVYLAWDRLRLDVLESKETEVTLCPGQEKK